MARKVATAAIFLLVVSGLAGATTLVKMGFADLARDAKQVVVGTVIGIDGEWDDSLTFIRSNVTLSVERSFRGDAADTIVVRTPGGRIGGAEQIALGTATFEIGERVLVFLTTWEDGAAKVLGYVQGKSSIEFDERGELRLRDGVAGGRSLDSVADELRHGPQHNIPLRLAD